jgi:hypothetical protein
MGISPQDADSNNFINNTPPSNMKSRRAAAATPTADTTLATPASTYGGPLDGYLGFTNFTPS